MTEVKGDYHVHYICPCGFHIEYSKWPVWPVCPKCGRPDKLFIRKTMREVYRSWGCTKSHIKWEEAPIYEVPQKEILNESCNQ